MGAAPLTFGAEKAAPSAGQPVKLKPYTLETCAVTGEKLGSMGKPFVMEFKDREIKLCCRGCKKDFDKEPAKHIKNVETAEKKAAEQAAAGKAKN
jgi:hypothetical protein